MQVLSPVGWTRAARRERGAVAVEAALVTPLLVLTRLRDRRVRPVLQGPARSHVRRSGGRTHCLRGAGHGHLRPGLLPTRWRRPRPRSTCPRPTELWVYKATGTTGQPAQLRQHRASGSPGTPPRTSSRPPTLSAWPGSAQHACVTDTNRDSVGVYLQVDHPDGHRPRPQQRHHEAVHGDEPRAHPGRFVPVRRRAVNRRRYVDRAAGDGGYVAIVHGTSDDRVHRPARVHGRRRTVVFRRPARAARGGRRGVGRRGKPAW